MPKIAPLTEGEPSGRFVVTFPPESTLIEPVIVGRGGETRTYPLREGDDGLGRYVVVDFGAGDCWTTDKRPAL